MGEPKVSIDTHHTEKNDLLEYQSFISSMVVDTTLENQKLLSQQPSIVVYPSMASTSIVNPSTDIHYPLTANPSMDIPSSYNPSLSDTVLFTL